MTSLIRIENLRMSDDTQPIPAPHEENLADKLADAFRAFYLRTPLTTIYGLATLVLAVSNLSEPTGGVARVFRGAWGFSPLAYDLVMVGFALTGLTMLFWTPLLRKPTPKMLFYPFLIYLGIVIISTFAASVTGASTWGNFGKTVAIHFAHGWLLTRELLWPE